MKIVVCIKQIAHTYARTGKDWTSNYLASEDRVYRINPYDEVAMEIASQIKKERGKTQIVAITLGPLIAETEFRRCLALGADRVLHIDQAASLDPWQKATLLAQAIKEEIPDLILCGKESLDSQNGQVGAFLAHHLGLAFVSAITKLSLHENQHQARVQRRGGRGIREIIDCICPAVFSVDMGEVEPHIPTYEEKRKAQSIPLEQFKIYETSFPGKVVSQRVYSPRPRPKQVPPIKPSAEAYERIQQLLGGTRVEKKGTMLKGSPESQAEGIVSFLRENGFIDVKSKKTSK